ncbi:MAG: nitrous oxide-stimulated promoter family protein [Chloroflexota bacterium]
MPKNNPRIKREARTLSAMISLYCHNRHKGNKLCSECETLLDYALKRLEKCPFQDNKPTCAKCPVHCYQASMREQIRAVMRYLGPRMMYHHPMLALFHLMDKSRGKTQKPKIILHK